MYFGCDPGLTGAITIFNDKGEYIENIRIKTLTKEGNPIVKKRINGIVLHSDIKKMMNTYEFIHSHDDPVCFLEHPSVIPSNGFVRIASLNHSIGIIEGVFVSLGVKVIYIQPKQWKKSFNLLGKHKHQSIIVALEQIPKIGKILKKDIDIAEAILIALYGIQHLKPLIRR